MAPRPFRKLLGSLPFANRSRSHHSNDRDVHDSTPAAAEAVAAVASNLTSGPGLVTAKVTAGEESASSGPEYRLDPEMARKYMANIKRFRILVIGRANAGKTTILQRVCNTTDNPEIYDGNGKKIENTIMRGTLERGHHNIEHEHVFSSNPGFVFHDSCGFEAGAAGQFEEMKRFVVNRAVTASLKERIHAIWFCIPMTDYQRTVTAAERKFFNECDTGHVPVIVLLTKTDALHLAAMEELLDANLEVGEAKEQAAGKEEELLERWLAHIKGILDECKFPPKAYVSVQKMHEEGADCSTLVECTTNAMREEGLQRLLISTQQSSIALCVEYAVKKTLTAKMELGFMGRLQVNVKDLQRELLKWFPNKTDLEAAWVASWAASEWRAAAELRARRAAELREAAERLREAAEEAAEREAAEERDLEAAEEEREAAEERDLEAAEEARAARARAWRGDHVIHSIVALDNC